MATQVARPESRPVQIRRFEQFQIAAIACEFLLQFAFAEHGHLSLLSLFPLAGVSLIGSAGLVALALCISRARQGWLRWVFLGLLLLSAAPFVELLTTKIFWQMSGWVVIPWPLQAAALAFAFSPQSSAWLRMVDPDALHARRMRRSSVAVAIFVVVLPLAPWAMLDIACTLFGSNTCI